MNDMRKTTRGVFIIESLKLIDESNERLEGLFLSRILKMAEVQSQYFYIRTKKEFEEIVRLFFESNYRYLHISCHGNETGIATTFDNILFDEMALILSPNLDNRRLFLSACLATRSELASRILMESDCYSIIGPKKEINFNDAAIFWASFYHLMFKLDTMKMADLTRTVRKVEGLFDVSINYFTKSRSKGFRQI